MAIVAVERAKPLLAFSASGAFQLELADPAATEPVCDLCSGAIVQPSSAKYASLGMGVYEGAKRVGDLDFISRRSQSSKPGDKWGVFRWMDQDANANGSSTCDGETFAYKQVGFEKGWNRLTFHALTPTETEITAPHAAELNWQVFSYGLGAQCASTCDGTLCQSGGTSVEKICIDSSLSLPCVGTATGMFCSRSCTADSACANENEPMKCLTSCPKNTNAQGKCWTESDHAFLTQRVCQ